MEPTVSKEVCDERHLNTNEKLEAINKNVDRLFGRFNYFYVLVIGSLAALVVQFIHK